MTKAATPARIIHDELRRLVLGGGKPHAAGSPEQDRIEEALDQCQERLLVCTARRVFAHIAAQLETRPLRAPYALPQTAAPRTGATSKLRGTD